MTGGIELGGTKTVVAVGMSDGAIAGQHRFPTTTPAETIDTAARWLTDNGPVERLGIATFGPVGLAPHHDHFGKILQTPKPNWSGFDLMESLRDQLGDLPISLDTDVNAAALAEQRRGAGRGLEDLAYITIGTGIGAGLIAQGRPVNGALHPEFGHLKVPRHPDDPFPGCCPYHRDCLEGLASGTAMRERWKTEALHLPNDHLAWEFEIWYLAHAVLSLLAITCPTRVIIGGGVSQAPGFHGKVEAKLRDLAGGYFSTLEKNSPYVLFPELGQDAGITGALLLGG